MKTITLALATALAGFAATTAKADNTRVNVGIGVTYGPSYSAPGPVYVPAPVIAPASNYNYGHSAPVRGHWENVSVKTWVPGRWVTSRDRWGRPVRFFEEGRYAFRTERVWVDNNRGGYGYNDNRGPWNR